MHEYKHITRMYPSYIVFRGGSSQDINFRNNFEKRLTIMSIKTIEGNMAKKICTLGSMSHTLIHRKT